MTNPTSILIVEDDANDSFLLTRQLAKANIDDYVTVIGDGRDALNFLLQSEKAPLAIFLDLKLPGLSGVELLERIRPDPRFQTVPVIVMTSSVATWDADACTRLGVTAYLPKPVTLTAFIKTVAHLFPKANASES